jgi:TolB protein
LVFAASNGGTIYVYNLASGALRPLTNGFDPAISPDGSQVVFTRDGGEKGIYLINIDGSNEHRIFDEGDTLRSPKWSPDGNWIVFSRDTGHWNCYQQGPQCVTRDTLLGRLPPAIAKNPAAVAKFLAQFDVVENPNWGIARVDSTGQQFRDIAAMDTARTPDWGDGGIVYQSTAGIQQTADKPDAENKAVVAGHNLQDPAWQPGGGRILYQSKRGDHWEIFSANPDGSGQVALTHPVTTLVDQLPSNGSPAWSPDGQQIVYLSNRGENNSAGAWRLWVMNADGSNQHPLPVNVLMEYSFNEEQMVSWGR